MKRLGGAPRTPDSHRDDAPVSAASPHPVAPPAPTRRQRQKRAEGGAVPPSLPAAAAASRRAEEDSSAPLKRLRSSAEEGPTHTSLSQVLLERAQTSSLSPLIRWVEKAGVKAIGARSRVVSSIVGARSTISITFDRSGSFLASTHGDHSIKLVDIDRDRVLHTLQGHPRTPWTVAFHPFKDYIMASGCLGGTVRLWNLANSTNTAILLPDHVISLAFHPAGDLLIVASGDLIFAWEFELPGSIPRLLIERRGRQRAVLFTPEGLLITAEPMRPVHDFLPENQSFMHIYSWPTLSANRIGEIIRQDHTIGEGDAWAEEPVSVADRVIAYNDGGLALSTCGTLLAFVHVPRDRGDVEHVIHDTASRINLVDERILAVYSLRVGRIVKQVLLPDEHGVGITSVKFSPADAHLVLGYGVRNRPIIPQTNALQRTVLVLGFDLSSGFSFANRLSSETEDVNIALFHCVPGGGIVLGTRSGNIRVVGGMYSMQDREL